MALDWRTTLIAPDTAIREAMAQLGRSRQHILLVVDGDQRLLGTMTDGDFRRAILAGVALEERVERIMNRSPRTVAPETSRAGLLALMQRSAIQAAPLVDPSGRVVGLARLEDLLQTEERRPNWVVILAGGLGQRLRPLTETIPKPMLPVGGRPILETIVEELATHGLCNLYLSVNYKAEIIRSHFGDGSRFGVEIRYLEERERLGTAGPLGLLPPDHADPLLVMNGDLLTKVDFGRMLDYHRDHAADITVGVRSYEMEVPYGVVSFEDNRIAGIVEKPVQSFMVSAGIYVVEPRVAAGVAGAGPLDMPDLVRGLIARQAPVVGFPIHEYWIDIGRHHELSRASEDYERFFS